MQDFLKTFIKFTGSKLALKKFNGNQRTTKESKELHFCNVKKSKKKLLNFKKQPLYYYQKLGIRLTAKNKKRLKAKERKK